MLCARAGALESRAAGRASQLDRGPVLFKALEPARTMTAPKETWPTSSAAPVSGGSFTPECTYASTRTPRSSRPCSSSLPRTVELERRRKIEARGITRATGACDPFVRRGSEQLRVVRSKPTNNAVAISSRPALVCGFHELRFRERFRPHRPASGISSSDRPSHLRSNPAGAVEAYRSAPNTQTHSLGARARRSDGTRAERNCGFGIGGRSPLETEERSPLEGWPFVSDSVPLPVRSRSRPDETRARHS